MVLEGQGMNTTLSFGERTFSGIDLGDKRRTARLIQAADDICRHPGGTLPDKFPKPPDLRAQGIEGIQVNRASHRGDRRECR